MSTDPSPAALLAWCEQCIDRMRHAVEWHRKHADRQAVAAYEQDLAQWEALAAIVRAHLTLEAEIEKLPRYRDREVHPFDPDLPVYTEIRETPDGCWFEVVDVLRLLAARGAQR